MDLVDGLDYQAQLKESSAPIVETATITGSMDSDRIVKANCSGSDEKVRVPLGVYVGVGDIVLLLRGKSKAWVIHRLSDSADLPEVGTVGTVGAGNTVPVNYVQNGKTYTINLPFLATYSPVNGDTVQINWRRDNSGGFILGKLGTIAPPPPAPAPPPDYYVLPTSAPGTSNSGTNTFSAQDAASYRNGAWRTDSGNVVQYDWGGYGVNNGAWFYGSAPRDYLNGATCLGLKIKVKRLSGGVWGPQTVHFHFHTSNSRPGGNVSYTLGPDNHDIDINQVSEFVLPTSWGQALIDTGGGIGIQSSPYVVLAGLNTMADSGLIMIDWTR